MRISGLRTCLGTAVFADAIYRQKHNVKGVAATDGQIRPPSLARGIDASIGDSCRPFAVDTDTRASWLVGSGELELTFRGYKLAMVEKPFLDIFGLAQEAAIPL